MVNTPSYRDPMKLRFFGFVFMQNWFKKTHIRNKNLKSLEIVTFTKKIRSDIISKRSMFAICSQ